jgi:hypothetical protein
MMIERKRRSARAGVALAHEACENRAMADVNAVENADRQ